MAAPSGTTWGSIVGGYGRIGIYRSVTTANDKISGTIEIWFWSKYSVSDTGNTLYYDRRTTSGSATTSKGNVSISTTHDSGSGWSTTNQKKLASYSYSDSRGTSDTTRYVYAKLANVDRVGGTMYASITYTVPKLPTYTITYNANGGSGAPGKQTKTYGKALTLSSTKPSRTGYTFSKWNTKADGSGTSYSSGASFNTNASVTLYAIWTINKYTLTYNANGGSGAPDKQTKNYNTTFTLSTSAPSRTGYTFQYWNTKSDGSGTTYKAGASFTIKSNTTLYAIWKINTYTITYNANGGSGAPGKQTKTYGKALTLSSTKPVRADYNFLGWSTSSTATAASYSAGGRLPANINDNTTLYAVWQLAYVEPKITGFGVARYAKNTESDQYVPSDTGTYAHVVFDWSTFHDVTSVEIEWSASGQTGDFKTITVSGKSGKVDEYVGGSITSEATYTFAVTVADSGGSTTVSKYLSGAKYVIDLKKGGNGIAFGKPAERDNIADFAFTIAPGGGFTYPILAVGTDLNTVRTPNIYVGENVSTDDYPNCPISSGTFTLEVISAGSSGQVIQRLKRCHKISGNTYERTYYSGEWGDWYGNWKTATLSSNFTSYYSSGSETPIYRRVGDVVEIRGTVKPVNEIASSTDYTTIFTLPEGYRPHVSVFTLCQGTSNCVWLLRVATNGEVGFTRYRDGDGLTAAANTVWLPFQCIFTV